MLAGSWVCALASKSIKSHFACLTRCRGAIVAVGISLLFKESCEISHRSRNHHQTRCHYFQLHKKNKKKNELETNCSVLLLFISPTKNQPCPCVARIVCDLPALCSRIPSRRWNSQYSSQGSQGPYSSPCIVRPRNWRRSLNLRRKIALGP